MMYPLRRLRRIAHFVVSSPQSCLPWTVVFLAPLPQLACCVSKLPHGAAMLKQPPPFSMLKFEPFHLP
jgi:hypothetical protein